MSTFYNCVRCYETHHESKVLNLQLNMDIEQCKHLKNYISIDMLPNLDEYKLQPDNAYGTFVNMLGSGLYFCFEHNANGLLSCIDEEGDLLHFNGDAIRDRLINIRPLSEVDIEDILALNTAVTIIQDTTTPGFLYSKLISLSNGKTGTIIGEIVSRTEWGCYKVARLDDGEFIHFTGLDMFEENIIILDEIYEDIEDCEIFMNLLSEKLVKTGVSRSLRSYLNIEGDNLDTDLSVCKLNQGSACVSCNN